MLFLLVFFTFVFSFLRALLFATFCFIWTFFAFSIPIKDSCISVCACAVCSVQIARLDPVQMRALGPRVAQEVRDGKFADVQDYMSARYGISGALTLLLE